MVERLLVFPDLDFDADELVQHVRAGLRIPRRSAERHGALALTDRLVLLPRYASARPRLAWSCGLSGVESSSASTACLACSAYARAPEASPASRRAWACVMAQAAELSSNAAGVSRPSRSVCSRSRTQTRS